MQRIYKAEYVHDYIVRVTLFNGEIREYDVENYYMSKDSYGRFLEYAGRIGGFKDLKVNALRTKVDLGEGFLVDSDAFMYGLLVGKEYIDDVNIIVAKAVQDMREKRGMTQKDLEEATGIHQAEISKIERGIGNPSLQTLTRIADGTGYRFKAEFIDRRIKHNVPLLESVAPYLEAGKYQGEFTIADIEGLPDDTRFELIDGCIFECTAPSTVHQELLKEMTFNIESYIRKNTGKCEVFFAPTALVFEDDDLNYFEPDLMIVCDKDKIKNNRIKGTPDYVLEIVSPSNSKHDYQLKNNVYCEKGVREYWILDPIRRRLTVYTKEDEWCPKVYTLDREVGLSVYENDLKIDLKKLNVIIAESEDRNA